MKTLSYIFVCLVLILWSTLGDAQENSIILQPVDKHFERHDLQTSVETIKQRLKILDIPAEVTMSLDPPEIKVKSQEKFPRNELIRLGTSRGNLAFHETVNRDSLLDDWKANESILKYLDQMNSHRAILGHADPRNQSWIEAELGDLRSRGKLDGVAIEWSALTNEEGWKAIYLLDSTQDPLVRTSMDSLTLINTSDQPIIAVQFNDQGGKDWVAMSERSIDQMIAVVLDDQVLMAPVVLESMSEGKAHISFHQDDFGLTTLHAIAISDPLPIALEVVRQ